MVDLIPRKVVKPQSLNQELVLQLKAFLGKVQILLVMLILTNILKP
jgi:hypothetical protein